MLHRFLYFVDLFSSVHLTLFVFRIPSHHDTFWIVIYQLRWIISKCLIYRKSIDVRFLISDKHLRFIFIMLASACLHQNILSYSGKHLLNQPPLKIVYHLQNLQALWLKMNSNYQVHFYRFFYLHLDLHFH